MIGPSSTAQRSIIASSLSATVQVNHQSSIRAAHVPLADDYSARIIRVRLAARIDFAPEATMHRLIARLMVTGLIVMGAFTSLTAGTAGATTAVPESSGGGCYTASSQGYRVGACISAHNNVVYPDYYVTNLPTNKCTLYWYVFHNGDIYRDNAGPCAVGHRYLPSGTGSGTWYDEIEIVSPTGTIVLYVDSPLEFN
jgi:hypothetical protein